MASRRRLGEPRLVALYQRRKQGKRNALLWRRPAKIAPLADMGAVRLLSKPYGSSYDTLYMSLTAHAILTRKYAKP